ncbi:hypothetical protein CVV68_05810 [Arthrobacter livingstonensis]|uniref:Uncharacterized protein n=1 Tax=Arthrobacter livingstonensis TaxID=670078 RepID=A0A2V5LBP7_9MICC|nr:hypothetical protein [Arthrobacter livingstonensis]PYI68798.1 hypothetical protein CVV68_05810 [Arthrobacter livingstonensis]
MAITFATSADRHGVPHEDALHATANALYSERVFDEPRAPGHGKPALFIGPPRDMFIFHVMEARPKNLERMKSNG